MSRSNGWCFTLNNYTDEVRVELLSMPCRYIIIGEEVGESKTPHLQGFVQFESPGKSLVAMKKINSHAHFEATKGSVDQNVAYCSKDGKFEERGIKPMSQKRKGEANVERWEEARQAAKEGRFDDIPADIYIQNLGNLKKIRAESQIVPLCLKGELQNHWIWGAPGSGKTSGAQRSHPGAYLKGLHKWWDGYEAQEVVIVDDMDPYHKSLAQDFKQWGHHSPFPAETKGGSLCIRPKKIIVTSNYRIDEVWEDETTRLAMKRRFTEVYQPSNEQITDTVTKL